MESDEHQTAENLPTNDVCSLTPMQKERIERNRLKAISLKRSRIEQRATGMGNEKKFKQTVEVDSHGGYFIEDDDKSTETLLTNRESTMDDKVVENDELLECEKCHQSFFHSFLWTSFRCSICDTCRDPKGEHKLITKTEAKDVSQSDEHYLINR
jgi:DNA-repair protein complementing XP-A cells